ncbi:MAG: hypothetical protein IKM51_04845, partial [Oscillospiraceae bacterium]|nr:hypothetical protein [Oscillospiraceae bacterium]
MENLHHHHHECDDPNCHEHHHHHECDDPNCHEHHHHHECDDPNCHEHHHHHECDDPNCHEHHHHHECDDPNCHEHHHHHECDDPNCHEHHHHHDHECDDPDCSCHDHHHDHEDVVNNTMVLSRTKEFSFDVPVSTDELKARGEKTFLHIGSLVAFEGVIVGHIKGVIQADGGSIAFSTTRTDAVDITPLSGWDKLG